MDGAFLEKVASGVKRIDKYAGLISLIASVLLGVAQRGSVFVYAFAGVTVAFLSLYLFRIIFFGERDGARDEPPASRLHRARRVLAILGLVVLYCAASAWIWWIITRPDLAILDVRINEDIALERLLSDYTLVEDGTITLTEAVIAYREGSPDVQQHVLDRVSGLPVGLPPLEMAVVVENRSNKDVLIKGIQVRVYDAAWLSDCVTYGPGINVFEEEVHVRLCPWWNETDLPRVEKGITDVSGNLKPGDPPAEIAVLLRNGEIGGCVEPTESVLATAIYDIDIEVVYGEHDRVARFKQRQLIAVPTLRYALGVGETGFETSATFDPDLTCHRGNLERADSLLALAEDRVIGPLIERLEIGYRAAQR